MINSIINTLKANGQDYEFYPTPKSLAPLIAGEIESANPWLDNVNYSDIPRTTVLDVCAGDGSFILALHDELMNTKRARQVTLQGIELSPILRDKWQGKIVPVGSNFYGIKVPTAPVVFCNPPFSKYVGFTKKVLKDSTFNIAIFILPRGWRSNQELQSFLRSNDHRHTVIKTFDFKEHCERAIRSQTICDVLVFHGKYSGDFERTRKEALKKQVAEIFDAEAEKGVMQTDLPTNFSLPDISKMYEKEKESRFELFKMLSSNNYAYTKSITGVDDKYARENLLDMFSDAYVALQRKYWGMVIKKLSVMGGLLTYENEQSLITDFAKSIDFNIETISLFLEWLTSNFQTVMDDQFIMGYKSLMNPANSVRYKNNQSLFKDGNWTTNEKGKYKSFLKKKVILEISNHYDAFGFTLISYEAKQQLTSLLINLSAVFGYWIAPTLYDSPNFKCNICDLKQHIKPSETSPLNDDAKLKIAKALQDFEDEPRPYGKSIPIYGITKEGNADLLMYLIIYKKGTLHVKLSKDFALKLNVKYGTINGWITNPDDAKSEFVNANGKKEYSDKEVDQCFTSQQMIKAPNELLRLTNH